MAEPSLLSSVVASSDDAVAAHPNNLRTDLLAHTHGGVNTALLQADSITTITGSRTLTLPTSASDTLVGKATTDVLTNKTLTSPVLTTPQINDTSADHQYIFAVSELTADRTVTLPLLTGADEFVFKDFIQTLTNKTLTSPVINTPTVSVNDGASLTLQNATDTTKKVQFDLANITTATTRSVQFPDDGTTLVGTTTIQTLTNKTLTSPVLTTPQINDTSADHQYIFAVSELTADRTVTLPLLTGADEFVFKDHPQTLTGKTLTSPIINTPSASGQVYSDTYTPTLALVGNLNAAVVFSGSVFQYTRIGARVFVAGIITATPTGAGDCEAGIPLPVASNFTNAAQCAGVGADQIEQGVISADTTNDRATFSWNSPAGAAREIGVTFSYLIV